MQPTKFTLLAALLLAAGACSERLDETFSDASGVTSYRFAPDGRVTVTISGHRYRAHYRVRGDTVRVFGTQGSVRLFRRAGRLYGPMGLVLHKEPANPQAAIK